MTPVLDLLDQLHDHDHQTRTRRTRVYVAVLASCLVLGAWGDGSMRRHDAHAYRCYAERSATVEGVEVIAYPAGAARTLPGVEVGCGR